MNVKLSNSQLNKLNKLKSALKDETDVVLGLSSNMIGNSNDETKFPHKLLLTNRQVANLHKVIISTSFSLPAAGVFPILFILDLNDPESTKLSFGLSL